MRQEYLKSILNYDPDTGEFSWAAARPKVRVGQRAGYKHHKGYIYIEIDGKQYSAHRLAWIYMNGNIPEKSIDHINRNRADNRIENLRLAENGQNRANSKSTSKSGYKGVVVKSWLKEKPYVAQIRHNGKQTHIGCYSTPEEAHEQYKIASSIAFGEFANP